jgi:uncharacterized membrane protein
MSAPEPQSRENLLNQLARLHVEEKSPVQQQELAAVTQSSEHQRKLGENTQKLRGHLAKEYGLDASATTQQILEEVEFWNAVTKRPSLRAYLEKRAAQQSMAVRKSLNSKFVWLTMVTIVILIAAGLYLLGMPDFHQIRYGLAGALIGAAIQLGKIVFDVMSTRIATARKANAKVKLPENLDAQEGLWRSMRNNELMLEKLQQESQERQRAMGLSPTIE